MSAAYRPSQGRRRFVQLLGWASVLAAAPGPTLAAAARARSESAKPRHKPPTPAAAAPEKNEISQDARALAAVLKRRYGEHWSADQLRSVATGLDDDHKAAARLGEVKLANSEEPDFTFNA